MVPEEAEIINGHEEVGPKFHAKNPKFKNVVRVSSEALDPFPPEGLGEQSVSAVTRAATAVGGAGQTQRDRPSRTAFCNLLKTLRPVCAPVRVPNEPILYFIKTVSTNGSYSSTK